VHSGVVKFDFCDPGVVGGCELWVMLLRLRQGPYL
jgi:hypothetical protein